MLVYLAGPIDAAPDDQDWHDEAAVILADKGFSTYTPGAPWLMPKHLARNARMARIVGEINRRVISECNALLAWVPLEPPPFGTIREIEYAKQRGIPVFCWGDRRAHHLESHDLIWPIREDEHDDMLVALRMLLRHFEGRRTIEQARTPEPAGSAAQALAPDAGGSGAAAGDRLGDRVSSRVRRA